MWKAAAALALVIILKINIAKAGFVRPSNEIVNSELSVPGHVLLFMPPKKWEEILVASARNNFKLPILKEPPLFPAVDRNKDGLISYTEYEISHRLALASSSDLGQAFAFFDYNEDGALDRREYNALSATEATQQRAQPTKSTNVAQLFKTSDANGDGVLSRNEYRLLFPTENATTTGLVGGLLDLTFVFVDANDDQVVSWDEFEKTTTISEDGKVSIQTNSENEDENEAKKRREDSFKKMDKNHDDFVTLAEFEMVLDSMDQNSTQENRSHRFLKGITGLAKSLATLAFISEDKNGDGRLSREEFLEKNNSKIDGVGRSSPISTSFYRRYTASSAEFQPAYPPKLITAAVPVLNAAATSIFPQFADVDWNKDGRVSLSEYDESRIRLPINSAKKKVLRMFFDAFNGKDKRGLDRNEYAALVKLEETALEVNEKSDEPFAFTLQLFDKDGNGVLNINEYRALMALLKRGGDRRGQPIPTSVIDYFFGEIDRNGDNTISSSEYISKPSLQLTKK